MSAFKGWRSPKAWVISAATVGGIWVAVYAISGNVATATTVSVISVVIGVVGIFYT